MKKIFIFSLAIVMMLGMVVGVQQQQVQAQDEDEEFTILVMPKLVGIPYFNASEKGAEQAGEDFDNIKVEYAGPSEADPAAQVTMIEDYIARGVDAIAVAPNDPDSLSPVLEEAKEEGILVMDWDTPADQDIVDYSIRQVDYEAYGRHIWDLLAEEMGEEGDYAVLTGGLSAENLNTWIDAGLDHAEKEYPDMNLVTERIGTDEKQQEAYKQTLDLLRAYPDLDGIIGVSTPAPIGAAQAIEEQGLQDEVAVVGTSVPNDSAPFLESGALRVATLWEPYKLGYLSAYVAKEHLEGNEIKDGMEVPEVGEVEVKEDGKTVIMSPPIDFTKDNVDEYDF